MAICKRRITFRKIKTFANITKKCFFHFYWNLLNHNVFVVLNVRLFENGFFIKDSIIEIESTSNIAKYLK